MIQKSQGQAPGMEIKPVVKYWDKLPSSTGFLAGFPVAITKVKGHFLKGHAAKVWIAEVGNDDIVVEKWPFLLFFAVKKMVCKCKMYVKYCRSQSCQMSFQEGSHKYPTTKTSGYHGVQPENTSMCP